MNEYFIPLCVIFFVIVLIVFLYIMIKGIIYDWAFFKPLLIYSVQGILMGCMAIMLLIGAVNLPDYVSKVLAFLR